MDSCVLTFWLLWIMLLWMWVCKELFKTSFQLFWINKHAQEELLDCTAILCLIFQGTAILLSITLTWASKRALLLQCLVIDYKRTRMISGRSPRRLLRYVSLPDSKIEIWWRNFSRDHLGFVWGGGKKNRFNRQSACSEMQVQENFIWSQGSWKLQWPFSGPDLRELCLSTPQGPETRYILTPRQRWDLC